jgi:hypothetical protein
VRLPLDFSRTIELTIYSTAWPPFLQPLDVHTRCQVRHH